MENTASAHRIARLRSWITNEFEGKIARLCQRYGLSASQASYISQILNGHRTLGEKAARRLESLTNRPQGWLDQGLQSVAPRRDPEPISVDMARIALLPPLERRKIEEYVEFVLSRAENNRRSATHSRTKTALDTDHVAPVPEPLRRAASAAARRPINSRTLTNHARKRRKSG